MTTSSVIVYANTITTVSCTIDTTNVSSGYATVTYNGAFAKTLKIKVSKDGIVSYYSYTLTTNEPAHIPLLLGDGIYTVLVLRNFAGNMYSVIQRKIFSAEIADKNGVFTISTPNINFNEDMEAVKAFDLLLKDAKTDNEKVDIIYNEIINNYTYDYVKASELQKDYVAAIDETYKTQKGICIDFATLFAGMLRHNGIPAKVVSGYAKYASSYHAWNEVFINGQWIAIDTSADSVYMKAGLSNSIQMVKDPVLFTAVTFY